MKLKITAIFAALFLSAGFVFAATNDITALLQKGLLEEEANHNLQAAMRHYQAAIDGFDQDRQLAATAVFRLGECLRKLGKTNEAGLQYERVLREFPDQTNLAKLCSDYLSGAKAATVSTGGSEARLQQLQTAYDDLKLKCIPVDAELATVTLLGKPEQEKYFTTVKTDSALVGFLVERAKVAAEFTEAQKLGYGPAHPMSVAAQKAMTVANDTVTNRIDTLVWGLQKEAQVLHDQGDALRALMDQARQGVAANAPAGGSAVENSATTAEDEEVRKIREMVRNSPDLINTPNDGVTPLQQSVLNGNIAAAELLLANGANVNGISSRGETPLSMAAKTGNKAMIELLLAKGADVNAGMPLYNAVVKGFKTAAEVLIAHKADPNMRRSDGSTALQAAAGSGFGAVAELLIANGAEVNAASTYGNTPLSMAVLYNHPELVQLLLASKAEVNLTDSAGETPLFMARQDDQTNVARLLLEAKAEVNHHNKSGYTPLHRAVINDQIELVRLFLSNKADVNAATDVGITPLLFAVARSDVDSNGGNSPSPGRMPGSPVSPRMPGSGGLGSAATNLIKILLDNGADTQVHTKEGSGSWGPIFPGIHALDLAMQFGRTDEMKLLLASHADPNARHATSQYSGTPLLWGVVYNYDNIEEEIKILLDHGAEPDLADQEGMTPLSHAVRRGQLTLVQELLDHHADPNKPDDRGLPPLAYVPQQGPTYAEIRAALLKAGANEDFQRLARIFIAQKGTGSLGEGVFYKGTNSVNHYTLLETLAEACKNHNGYPPVDFPDFAHVVINRLKAGGAKEEINVNLEEILASGDCSKDVPLEWGDVLQIPQLDHLLNQQVDPLPPNDREALTKCLQRQVQIVVKGQTTKLTLLPAIAESSGRLAMHSGPGQTLTIGVSGPPTAEASGHPAERTLYTFSLNEVVHQANVLLLSSDLSRVKVTRHGAELLYSLEPLAGGRGGPGRRGGGGGGGGRGFGMASNDDNDLWLRDGDVIEIPERDPNAPLVK
ncbi:MAG: ankyrin repeat domain-containing protein [Verrucomicrobiota bacterium]|jgi:cytohesin